ncbi:type II toxin-antitoxin system RelE/ParE family toxin [Collimonas pratensis]|nr:type II toxin-antitoxin system RelE/ParE family toxin [Collimonas pratensis]
MIEYQVSYYSQQIQADIMSLPATLQARYLSLTARMKIYGPHLGEPHTKMLGNGLLELRLKGAEGIARVFYCTMAGKQIVMLHSFVKKTQKIPFKEKRIAEIRMREVKNER